MVNSEKAYNILSFTQTIFHIINLNFEIQMGFMINFVNLINSSFRIFMSFDILNRLLKQFLWLSIWQKFKCYLTYFLRS
jgi:hypothetical protein